MQETTRAAGDATARRAPGPPGVPILGNYPELQRRGQLRFNVDNWHRFGDVVRLQLGPIVAHTVAHPDAIRHVLIENKANYNRGRGYQALQLLNGQGLLTSEGAFWQRQRRLIQPAFTPKAIPPYAPAIVDSTAAMLDRWSGPAQTGQALDVNVEMLHLALNIIGRTMLGVDLDREARELVPAFATAVAAVGARITAPVDIPLAVPTPANVRFRRALRQLDTRIYSLMQAHQAGDGRADLLAQLLAARDPETGTGMTPQQVRDEIMTIFFAGHETIAQTLTWAWYLLAQHPDAEARLHAELAAVLDGRPPAVADLPRLPYTRMVIEETMRLYPPVWAIPRGAAGPDTLGGYSIPAGSMVFPAPYLAHRHPDFWTDPERFDPERFTPEHAAGRAPCSYLPFGAGPRACIGQNFAMQEALLVVATVAQQYRLRLVPGHPVVPHSAITLSPQHGVLMTLAQR